MFYFRINRLRIVDNREHRQLLRFFGTDRAEVKLLSFVATEETRLPAVDELLATDNAHRRKALMETAVSDVVAARVLTTIENVKDDHEMTFGDTGYVLHQAERIPSHFDWLLVALESDRDVRDIGDEVNAVVRDRGFDEFITRTLEVAATAVNPSYMVAVGIGRLVAKTLIEQCQENTDDMIGLLYTSLNRREHYLHGERKRDNVADLTNNMFVDYSIFGFENSPRSLPMERLPPVAGRIRPRRRRAA